VVAIAEQLRLPVERVQRWIAEEQQNPPQQGVAALEALKAALRKFCPKCGREILGGYILRGGREYHPEC
jgi:hypothetical protein